MAAGTNPPALPPSVEEAYRKKCIELRRRTIEVEESNDTYRLRKARLQRGIRKMRLERAYLLEILGKRMNKNSDSVDAYMDPHDEDSEGSSEAPPTVCIFTILHTAPRHSKLCSANDLYLVAERKASSLQAQPPSPSQLSSSSPGPPATQTSRTFTITSNLRFRATKRPVSRVSISARPDHQWSFNHTTPTDPLPSPNQFHQPSCCSSLTPGSCTPTHRIPRILPSAHSSATRSLSISQRRRRCRYRKTSVGERGANQTRIRRHV